MALQLFVTAVKLLGYSFIAGTVYYILTVVNNLFFSPLSHIPGPFWCKFSSIPSSYHAVKGDRHIWIWQQFQLYGDTVRISPSTVLFKSPTAYKDIYGVKSNVTRAKIYGAFQRAKNDVNTFNTSDVQVHRDKRRLLNLALTDKSLQTAEDFVVGHVDRWNELLTAADTEAGEWSSEVDMTEQSDCLALDIMGDLSFGVQFNTKERSEGRFDQVSQSIHDYMKFTYGIVCSPLLPFLLWAKPRGLDSLLQAVAPPSIKDYYEFIEESVSTRQKDLAEAKAKGVTSMKSAREDLFHYLCEARHPDHGGPAYTDQELRAEANLLIVAGSDTTSIQISGFFFYITRNMRCYDKVVAEIRDTFTSVEEIRQGHKMNSCMYLRACLDESMRLTPAIPSELARLVLPGGQTIDGQHYPEGVVVGASQWSSARHEDLGDPFVYRPERWIVNEDTGVTEADVRRVKSFSHPFSYGGTNCIGQNLAMLELLITVCRTLWRFDVRSVPGNTVGEGHPSRGWGQRDPKQYVFRDAFVTARDGPMLQFRKRES